MIQITVMGLTVSSDQTFALTVSADHLIGKYSLLVRIIRLSVLP